MIGNSLISSNNQHLWDLTYSCLIRYGCPVQFEKTDPNCPYKIDENIIFFVPYDHPNVQEVMQYIKEELSDKIKEGRDMPDGSYLFGCKVDVHEYTGPNFYLDKKQMFPLIQKTMNDLKEYFNTKYQKTIN